MTDLRKAAEMALEALDSDNPDIQLRAAIALRQSLETEQEPVAWRYALDASVEGPRWIYIDKDPHQWLQGPAMVNAAIEELHTSPQPSKPWVGLTDEELAEIDGVEMKYIGTGEYVIDGEYEFARAIETKLREKNT